MTDPVVGQPWPGGPVPPTNAEQYAAAKVLLDRSYDVSLRVGDRRQAMQELRQTLDKLSYTVTEAVLPE